MFYLKVTYVDDNDCELYKFRKFISAVQFIEDEKVEEFVLSTSIFEEYPEGEYVFPYTTEED